MRRESWSMTVDCKRLRQELSQQNNMLQFSLTASRRWKPGLSSTPNTSMTRSGN